MFNAGKKQRLPKLLIMDEPDAHLHPSAIRDFINVIERVLVGKHGVRVLMSTHSPTTVSFSPEYSLFEMSKSPPQIKPLSSKEHGIALLTDGLVTVKPNMKYVLVEDKDDAVYFSAIFAALRSNGFLSPDVGVIFIPSSNASAGTSGGSSVVKSWVDKFLDEGVFDIFQGLIDKDNGNEASQNVLVLERYSIENYLLDPVLLFSSILHEDMEYSIQGIDVSHKDEYKLGNLTQPEFQTVADHILSEVRPTLTGLANNANDLVEVEFVSGFRLQYPRWLLEKRGHDLYAKFQFKFGKAANMDNLIKALVRHEIIPTDLLQLLNEIQKSG